MIQLASNSLPEHTQQRLDNLQQEVNNESTFESKKDKASKLWDSKNNTIVGKEAFGEVKGVLEEMCISTGLCNYCEHDRANDIEHIAPKSFYPEKAFVWDNYLLACKQCNTGYKLDKCSVLDIDNNLIELKRGQQPPINGEFAFLNPRIEDPSDFMIINLQTFTYGIRRGISDRDRIRTEKTIDVLSLNSDDSLIVSRKSAMNAYYDQMDRLLRIISAKSNDEILEVCSPADEDKLDLSDNIEENKERLKLNFKKTIQNHKHPSVWLAIKITARVTSNKWRRIFNNLPEALDW